MIIKSPPQEERKFELPKPGIQIARLIRIIDLGTQEGEYKGVKKMIDKVKFVFELPLQSRVFKEGEPAGCFRVSKEYTKSTYIKADIRKDFEAWAQRSLTEKEEKEGIEIGKLLGRACQVQVVIKTSQKGKQYASVTAVLPLNKEIKDESEQILQHAQVCPPTKSELILFDMNIPETLVNLDKLAKAEKEKIMATQEYRNLVSSNIMQNSEESPFHDTVPEEDEF
jgi:hypothetical protein